MSSIDSDSTPAAVAANPPTTGDPLSGAGRSAWLLVAGTLLVAICLVAVSWSWQSTAGDGSGSAQSGQLMVTIQQGAGYGEAEVYVGPPVGTPIANQTALVEVLRRRWSTAPTNTSVLIRAAGGVYQREVDQVLAAVRESAPAGRSVTFRITPLESHSQAP